MGTAYRIHCAHCGTQFEQTSPCSFGLPAPSAGCGDYVETQTAIRCPVCLKRLNASQEVFRRQVEVTYLWD